MFLGETGIQFQIIALLLILMVLLLYCTRIRLRVTREAVFLAIILVSLTCCLLDIASILGIYMPLYIPVDVTALIRRLYCISLMAVGLCVLMYTLAEIYDVEMFADRYRLILLLPFLVAIPVVMNLPLRIRTPEGDVGGASAYVTCAICCLYMSISLFYAVTKGDNIKSERKSIIFLTPFILVACGALQMLYQDMRLMSLGVAMVLTLTYMALESPDVYVDKTFNCFNTDAFNLYLDNRCRSYRPVSVLYVSVREYSNFNEIAGVVITSELISKAAAYLGTIEGGRLFSLDAGNFALTFDDEAHFFDHAQEIRNRFRSVWVTDAAYARSMVEFEMRVSIVAYGAVTMPRGISAGEVKSIILYFAHKLADGKEDYICIDRRQIWEMEAVEHVHREIEGAVEEGRVDVFYQPIFSVYENKCSEVEALIRIRDKRNIYFDNRLILSAAESTGEITELGYEVFRKICSFATGNDLKKAGITKIAVNLSMVQCQQRQLAENLIEIMEKYSVPASLFRFEISENTAEYMTHNLRRNMNRLIAQGSSFVIDDYGKRRIDPDKVTQISRDYIKLGEGVIRKYFSGEKSKQSMRVLCRMLLQLKMIIAAVGVETQKEYFELKNLGITHMQGNAFFRPMPGEVLLATLENEKEVILGKEAQLERTL